MSGVAPYYPIELGFGSSVVETFSRWGSVSPLRAPAVSAPLNSILTPTADQGLLSRISASQADVPSGSTVAVIPGGEEVLGQVTLNFCSDSYASEKLRVDRRQVAVIKPGGDSSEFSTEAVVYKAAKDTATAFTEIAAAAAHCDGSSPVRIGTLWPRPHGVDVIAYSTSSPDASGVAVSTVVYLRRGSLLVGLYFNATSPTALPYPVAGSTSIETITQFFEARLAALR